MSHGHIWRPKSSGLSAPKHSGPKPGGPKSGGPLSPSAVLPVMAVLKNFFFKKTLCIGFGFENHLNHFQDRFKCNYFKKYHGVIILIIKFTNVIHGVLIQ